MSNQALTCRRITRDEVSGSARVVFEAFNRLAGEKGYPKTPNVQIVADRLVEYLDDPGIPGALYGGFSGEDQVGFFMLRKLGMDEEAWEISMLSVLPEHQRKGYAAKMLDFAQREVILAGGVLIVCAVTEGNEPVLDFFANRGFECEASGIPVGQDMSIWMLRKDMKNAAAAEKARAEAQKEAEEEAKLFGCSPEDCADCGKDCGQRK